MNLFEFEPNSICIYKPIKTNIFKIFELSDFSPLNTDELKVFQPIQPMYYKASPEIKLTTDFQNIILRFEQMQSISLVDNFLKLIFNKQWFNLTFVLSDSQGFFLRHLTSKLISHGICPKIMSDLGKIILLEIPNIKIRFVTAEMYQINSAFEKGIKEKYKMGEYFFCQLYNCKKNYDYSGKIPAECFFQEITDSLEEQKQKLIFHQSYNKKLWDFKKELRTFLNYKCLLLSLCCLNFIEENFDLQKKLQIFLDSSHPNKDKFLNPFARSMTTFSSYIYKLYRGIFLLDEEIYAIYDENSTLNRNVSKNEIEWAQFMCFNEKEKQYRHNFNHPKGQKFFKECIPDLYSSISKEVWFFNGCYWHGHLPKDCLKPSTTGFNNTLNRTFESLNKEFDEKIKRFKNSYPQYKINIVWECQYAQTKTTLNFFLFQMATFSEHPLVRLRPRTTVRGGYNQVYKFIWNKNPKSSESFFAIDINGLYSFCAIKFPMNYGPYEIVIGTDLRNLNLENNKFYYKSIKVYGAMQVCIVPPQNLYLPFLMYRLTNEKNVLTLCRTCSENNSKKIGSCKHTEIERALTSSYLVEEIEYALTLGYKILRVYELHAYFEKKHILSNFVKILDSFKYKFSDFSKSTLTKDQICQRINLELNLPKSFEIETNELERNPLKKQFYKLTSNALFGKLQQRSDFPKTRFIASHYELEEMYKKYTENIVNIVCHNSEVCQVDYYENPSKKQINLRQNCYLGAEITSNARITLYTYLQKLHDTKGIEIYYCDTDSIFGTKQDSIDLPLALGEMVGEFKHVVQGEIKSFYCLGPKNYCITYKDDLDVEKSVLKVCGLNLTTFFVNNSINNFLYQKYVESFFADIFENKVIPTIKKPRLQQPNLLETFTFNNNITSDRIIDKHLKTSFPKGFLSK